MPFHTTPLGSGTAVQPAMPAVVAGGGGEVGGGGDGVGGGGETGALPASAGMPAMPREPPWPSSPLPILLLLLELPSGPWQPKPAATVQNAAASLAVSILRIVVSARRPRAA